jgi:CheY-specific phosphatase CheX
VQNIIDVIRGSALARFHSHSGDSEAVITMLDDSYAREVHGNWMGLILVSGKEVRVTFKTYFNIKDVRIILASMLGKEPSDMSKELAIDFMKEFSNLTAGFIKKILEENENPIDTGISLPIVTKGFDDLFYKAINAKEIQDFWAIDVQGVRFYCSPCINIFNENKLKSVLMPVLSDDDDDDGDIDFL